MSRSGETLAQATGHKVTPKRKALSQPMVNYLASAPELSESLMDGNILTYRDIDTRREEKTAQVARLLDQIQPSARNNGPP
ncbi:hypothetical protein F4810DRAFT_620026 [Camillea tinctor]|nr:hypothetical protein F4810DRAFT_620026 [Camillea tinctor]